MMVAADVVAKPIVLLELHRRELFEDFAAPCCMAFHQLELLGGQTSGFIEDRVGDRDFPDVMHGSRVADNLDHIAVEAVLRFLLPQRFQKQLGDIAYPRDMLARFAAAELYRCAQCVNEELVGPAQFAGLLLNLVDLLGDCPFQYKKTANLFLYGSSP